MPSLNLIDLTPEQLRLLSNISVIQPPAGVKPNLVDPTNHNTPLSVGTSLLFVLFQVYTKIYIVRKFSWDKDLRHCGPPGK